MDRCRFYHPRQCHRPAARAEYPPWVSCYRRLGRTPRRLAEAERGLSYPEMFPLIWQAPQRPSLRLRKLNDNGLKRLKTGLRLLRGLLHNLNRLKLIAKASKYGWAIGMLNHWFVSPRLCRHEQRGCLLYTSPSPRDRTRSRMPSSA